MRTLAIALISLRFRGAIGAITGPWSLAGMWFHLIAVGDAIGPFEPGTTSARSCRTEASTVCLFVLCSQTVYG
jgi:hypothetical protein